LSVDPVGASDTSFNRYWYASNSPYRFIDPDGREITLAVANGATWKDAVLTVSYLM